MNIKEKLMYWLADIKHGACEMAYFEGHSDGFGEGFEAGQIAALKYAVGSGKAVHATVAEVCDE